jgi:hypothetical protein
MPTTTRRSAMIHTRCLAVLEVMWGTPGKAPGIFRINPNNHTGRRLYWLLGHDDLLVTNACPEQVGHPTLHGRPDPLWLAKNLQRVAYDLLLICGRVAQRTFDQCGYRPQCRIIEMPHPAARCWTKADLLTFQEMIQNGH